MRIMIVNICGRDYPVCFSTRVLVAGEEKFGSLDGFERAVLSPDIAVKDFIWFLSVMLDAGYRAEKTEDPDIQAPPSYEDLLDLIGMDDIPGIRKSMMQAQARRAERKVRLEEIKNARATQQGLT